MLVTANTTTVDTESAKNTPQSATTATIHAWMLCWCSIALTVAIRLPTVLSAGFPLGDGGLFYSMMQAIQRAHYALPASSGYNMIPFEYPPLALYVATFLGSFTNIGLLSALRFLPLAASAAAIVPFAWLASRILRSQVSIAVAIFAYPLLPRSFSTLITGGGLTRSFGLIFSLSALVCAYEMYTNPRWVFTCLAALFSGLTVLSHLEMTWFLAISLVLLYGFYSRSARGAVSTVFTGIGAAAISAPWWLFILRRVGLTAFIAAAHTGGAMTGSFFSVVVRFNITNEPFFPILAGIAMAGLAVCLWRRQWFLPTWFLAVMVLDTRSFETDAAVPLALAIGIAINEIVLHDASRSPSGENRTNNRPLIQVRSLLCRCLRPLPVALTIVALYSVFGSLVMLSGFDAPIPPEQRAAMAWIAANTQPDSSVLIITGHTPWGSDNTSEWFPALTKRQSIATVQGSEWLPNGAFAHQISAYTAIQACAQSDVTCLRHWEVTFKDPFSYIFMTRPSLPTTGSQSDSADGRWALELALRADPHYAIVYDRSSVVIFVVRDESLVTVGPAT